MTFTFIRLTYIIFSLIIFILVKDNISFCDTETESEKDTTSEKVDQKFGSTLFFAFLIFWNASLAGFLPITHILAAGKVAVFILKIFNCNFFPVDALIFVPITTINPVIDPFFFTFLPLAETFIKNNPHLFYAFPYNEETKLLLNSFMAAHIDAAYKFMTLKVFDNKLFLEFVANRCADYIIDQDPSRSIKYSNEEINKAYKMANEWFFSTKTNARLQMHIGKINTTTIGLYPYIKMYRALAQKNPKGPTIMDEID